VVGRGCPPSRPGLPGRIGRARPIGVGAAGFTLLEVLMVVALAMVVSAIAIPVSRNMLSRSKATGANMEVMSWLEMARNRATAERRNFEVTFDSTQRSIQIQRIEADGTKTAPVQLRHLPENVGFVQFSGATDTPDAFGAASPIVFSGPTPHMFTTDGSFIDSNGDPSNGTLFMGKPGQRDTGTALTVFGATGLLRAWRLTGNKWIR
jgi:Tfp pilus assembly protein FimT